MIVQDLELHELLKTDCACGYVCDNGQLSMMMMMIRMMIMMMMRRRRGGDDNEKTC